MKILITGGSGFVGKHFIDHLFKGNHITNVDVKNKEDRGFGIYTGEKTDGTIHNLSMDCRDYLKESTEIFDLVIHLAAIVGGRMTIERNPIAVATDLSIDAEMFNWAVRTKQPRVVYFSSSAAYPTKLQDANKWMAKKLHESDINLNSISNPDMTYGWAKLTGEMLAEYARKQGVKVHVFRPFSGYGEDQDLDYPFPSFAKRIRDRVPEFEIWGDGEQVRDFIHIDDIVEAVMRSVELDIQEPINLGSGKGTSFNELAELMMSVSGHRVPVRHRADRPVGVQYRVSDNSKMLGFYVPKISLEEGIRRSLAM